MSLNIDTRQRAMLDAMGITVWWPDAGKLAPSTQPQPVDVAASKPTNAIENAPENIAIGAIASSRKPAFEPPSRALTPSGVPTQAPPATPDALRTVDWTALQDTVSQCQACALCQTRKNTVFGVGQAGATPDAAPVVDWLIVGEAPGENEDIEGEPFVGQAGKLLDNMLRGLGLARHQGVFIANVLKCRPPGNRNPTPEEVAQCAPFLLRQIELLQPRIILAMGRFAINTLLAPTVPGVEAIPVGKLRDQVHRFGHTPVVVTYHPAYLLRNLPEKSKAWADLCLAHQALSQD